MNNPDYVLTYVKANIYTSSYDVPVYIHKNKLNTIKYNKSLVIPVNINDDKKK